jgi:hypothetical protein
LQGWSTATATGLAMDLVESPLACPGFRACRYRHKRLARRPGQAYMSAHTHDSLFSYISIMDKSVAS